MQNKQIDCVVYVYESDFGTVFLPKEILRASKFRKDGQLDRRCKKLNVEIVKLVDDFEQSHISRFNQEISLCQTPSLTP